MSRHLDRALAMSNILTESSAVLKERAAKVGLADEVLDFLVKQGVDDTLAKLAFAAGQPGETPTEAKLKELSKFDGIMNPLWEPWLR